MICLVVAVHLIVLAVFFFMVLGVVLYLIFDLFLTSPLPALLAACLLRQAMHTPGCLHRQSFVQRL
jgi:hypothetical protein